MLLLYYQSIVFDIDTAGRRVQYSTPKSESIPYCIYKTNISKD